MASEWDTGRAGVILTLGRLLSRVGEHDCAIDVVQKAIEIAPDMTEAHFELGVNYGQVEDYEAMIESFRSAIRLDHQAVRAAAFNYPDEVAELYRLISPPEKNTGRPVMAGRQSEIPHEVKEAAALSALASYHLKEGRDADAVTVLERSLTLDPINWVSVVNLLVAYLLLEFNGRMPQVGRRESALWEIDFRLAMALFGT